MIDARPCSARRRARSARRCPARGRRRRRGTAGADLRTGQVGEHADRAADARPRPRGRSPAARGARRSVPWLRFRRTTSTPARSSASSRAGVLASPARAWRRSSSAGSRSLSTPWAPARAAPSWVRCPPPDDDPTAPLRAYLDASPSPWHAVQTVGGPARRRRVRGRRRARDRGSTCRPPGSSSAAGRWSPGAGRRAAEPRPVRIVGAHTDSPGLRIKPATRTAGGPAGASSASRSTAACCSTAGSTATSASPAGSCSPTAPTRSSPSHEPVARVPQLAIHLDRDVNERGLVLDRQAHLTPVWATTRATPFERVDRRTGRARRCPAAWELVPVRRAAGGACSAPIDRCWPAGGSTTWRRAGRRPTALVAAEPSDHVAMIALFDHEEVGSASHDRRRRARSWRPCSSGC